MSLSPHADLPATLIDELVPIPGLAGHETPIARAMAARLGAVAGSVRVDSLGNVIARLGPDHAPSRVAVLAHMDTVGFLVKAIDPAGFLRVVPVGGVNSKALPGSAVRIWPSDGQDIPGVIAVRSQHLAHHGDETHTIDDLVIQVAPEAIPAIAVTDPVTYAARVERLGDHLIAAPYLDNRAGCAVLLALAGSLAEHSPAHTVYLVGTVQEETTCAGAMSVLSTIKPDVAIFVDGTLSYDLPETRHRGAVRLGGGPVLTAYLYVSGLNGWHAHPVLREHLKTTASAEAIPYQQDAIRGLMSDARVSGWLGIPSALVGLPVRGKHSPLETIHRDDLSHAANLIAAVLARPLPDLGWE